MQFPFGMHPSQAPPGALLAGGAHGGQPGTVGARGRGNRGVILFEKCGNNRKNRTLWIAVARVLQGVDGACGSIAFWFLG